MNRVCHEKLKTWSCKELMESKSPSDVTTWMDNGQRSLNLGTKSELWKFGDTNVVAAAHQPLVPTVSA